MLGAQAARRANSEAEGAAKRTGTRGRASARERTAKVRSARDLSRADFIPIHSAASR
ncbi:hypothetical protein A176_006952 [Myxococcus hansupus]|uniref:Uncharacterized protein n=1 Tax=Pseudomyxococcus hansupus TaxID=1297742 RepID=A0A0H4X902_9BACT|nr:hypothetical protein A176_006952 [Myxococcus hansupus]